MASPVCPSANPEPISAHWGFPDPAAVEGSDDEKRRTFEQVFRHMMNRVRVFVNLPLKMLDQASIKRELDSIGTRASITEAGMLWRDGKNHDKPPVLIEWSPELRATIDEALAIKRHHVAGSLYLFGNLRGQPYTKGGWKAVLDDLMRDCEAEAAQRGVKFQRFSLQDCRPKAVSDKLARGDADTWDATGHTSDAMIAQVYDRRRIKKATPAG